MAGVLVAIDDHPRNYASLAAVRGLRAGGHEPVVAGPTRSAYAALSRAAAGFVRAPAAREEPEAFVAALASAAASGRFAAVLPASEAALVALAGREQDFPHAPLGVGPATSIARARDKPSLAELAARAGLETPPTRVVAREELRTAAIELPAIAKPEQTLVELDDGGRRRIRARRLSTPEDVAALAELDAATWVIQPFVDGALYAVGGVAWQGSLVCAVHQVARRLWPPQTGGSSFAVTVAPDADLDRRLDALLRELSWSGIYQAQLLEIGGRRYLIDLNLRVYGSIGLAIAAGANLPAIWADLLLGRAPAVGEYRVGVGFRAPEYDARAVLLELRAGKRNAWRALLPHRPGVQSVFSPVDPLPVLALAAAAGTRLRRRQR